jgi:hypothetical protein
MVFRVYGDLSMLPNQFSLNYHGPRPYANINSGWLIQTTAETRIIYICIYIYLCIYMYYFDFRKINGWTKKFEKYTSGAVSHGGKFEPPWGTALGVAPTVGWLARWRQIPAAVGHGGKNPSVVGHGVRSPSAMPHGGMVLLPWATAAASLLYKGATRAAAGPHSLPLPLNLRLSTFGALLRYVSKFSLV